MALGFGHQLGIDIGTYSVKIVEIAPLLRRGPTIVRHCEEPFPSSPLPLDLENGERPPEDEKGVFDRSNPRMVGEFIRDVLEDHKIQRLRCVCAVPRHLAIVKTLELPPADEVEIQQMARFQGEKEIPFPADQCVMDYSVISRKETGESTVAIAAVKSEIVEFYTQVADAAKLKLVALEVSPFAHFNSPDLETLMGYDGISVLLDIGGDTTEIAIKRNDEIAFTRSVFIGSEMLVKSLSSNTLDSSETSLEKMRQTLRSVTTNPLPPELEKLQKSQEFSAWVARLTRELKRSFDSFNAKSNDERIERLVIVGGISGLPMLKECLATELNIEVESIDSSVEFSRAMGIESRSFSLAVGLASRGLTSDGCHFDLIHSSFAEKKRRSPIKSSRLVIPAIAAAVLLFALPIILVDAKQREIAHLNNNLNFLKPRSAKVEELRDKLRLYGPWTDNRISWLDVLRELSACTTVNKRGEKYIGVYVTDLSFRESKSSERSKRRNRNLEAKNLKVVLNGRARTPDDVEKFLEQLRISPYFDKVKLSHTAHVLGKKGEPSGEDFEVVADVVGMSAVR